MENGLKIKAFFFVVFSAFSALSTADIGINDDFNYLNQLRESAQLTTFRWNENLADAAQNHANYLSLHNKHGHEEQAGQSLFTGKWATDRAIFAGYPNRLVGENVTSKQGDNTFYNPIDSLMGAIYHRFGFLDLINNELGIGHQVGTIYSYVYVTGNSRMSDLCHAEEFSGYGEYNYNVCKRKKKKLSKKKVIELNYEQLEKNPAIILWPPKNATNVIPVFYQESPDPLPYHDVSGYPVSIQFNPANFKKPPKIISFTLHKTVNDELIEAIMIMDKNNDPNQKFSAFQHALFPENRLDWHTEYRAFVDYFDPNNNKISQLSWVFETQNLNAKIIIINKPHQTIPVKAFENIVLYFPPENAKDTQTTLSYRDYQMKLKLNYIDKNTLNVYVSRPGKAEIIFHKKIVELITY